MGDCGGILHVHFVVFLFRVPVVFLWCSVLGSTAGVAMIAKAFLPTYPVDSLHNYNSTDIYHLILHAIQRVQRVRGVLLGEGWRGDSGQRVLCFNGFLIQTSAKGEEKER
eukprot:sb/3477309/